METTALYAELTIIGLETTMWMTSFSIYFTNIAYVSLLSNISENIPITIFSLGIMYFIGIIVDRFTDRIFKKYEENLKSKSGLISKSTMLIWRTTEQQSFFKYARSKMRILRASAINIPILSISVVLNTMRYYGWKNAFFVFIVVIGISFSVFTWIAYKHSVVSYYNKARVIESEIKKGNGKK